MYLRTKCSKNNSSEGVKINSGLQAINFQLFQALQSEHNLKKHDYSEQNIYIERIQIIETSNLRSTILSRSVVGRAGILLEPLQS